ncbi:MAG: cytochrome C biogenesis protein [Chloroflexi bacterium]|nr:MAG: cytochrome C biogenesis protein [Chloroflexota bacterium]
MKTSFLTVVVAIVAKDLRAELRSRELISAMVLFALLSILIFSFALELNRIAREEAVTGVLWVTVSFASILGLSRSLAMERDQGNLDAMLMAPVARQAVFFGKLVGNFIFALVVGLLLLPLMTVLYNKILVVPWLLLILILGTLGYTTVGTLLATMTVQTRSRETLLPILILPVALPVLLPAVRASTGILSGVPRAEWIDWPQILIVINVIYIVLSYLLFEYVIED